MESRTDIQPNSKSFMTSERTNSSVQISLHRPKVYQVRRKLVLLLVTMFIFSFLYLLFISFSCAFENYVWLCEYYNRHYEFFWALISVVYDGLWLLAAYRCYHRLLLCFAWLSGAFLIVFGILLVMALLNVLQTLVIVHTIPTYVLLTSLSSILTCIITTILQVVIIFFSFELSKSIIQQENDTMIC